MAEKGNGGTATGTEVVVGQRKTLMQALANSQKAISEVLPRHLTPERMLRLTVLVANKTPKLLQCDPIDVVAAVVDASRLGLEIGTQAHLVPFYNNRAQKMEVVLIPDYRGIADLARRSGEVVSIDARTVYQGEKFEVQFGTDPKIVHVPDFTLSRANEHVVAFYMVAHLPGDAHPKFEVMTKLEVDAIKGRSKAKDSGPWVSDYQEMGKKTVVKRGCKLLPQSPELAAALEYDNRLETGEIGTPSDILDTPEEISNHVRRATMARAEELKDRIVGKKDQPALVDEEAEIRRQEQEEQKREKKAEREPGDD